jgi:hypothetical protein
VSENEMVKNFALQSRALFFWRCVGTEGGLVVLPLKILKILEAIWCILVHSESKI